MVSKGENRVRRESCIGGNVNGKIDRERSGKERSNHSCHDISFFFFLFNFKQTSYHGDK